MKNIICKFFGHRLDYQWKYTLVCTRCAAWTDCDYNLYGNTREKIYNYERELLEATKSTGSSKASEGGL